MGTAERRSEILKILCRSRHETVPRLAAELGVSERTIRRDIEALSLTAPLYTQQGRYDGGVYVMDGYSADRMYFAERETAVMRRLVADAEATGYCRLDASELRILKELLAAYSKPTVDTENERRSYESK